VIIIKNILVIGSLNMDFVIEVDKMPLPGQTILGEEFALIPGGKGANQAYAAGKLGANVSMLGAVGNDEYGKKLLKNLNSVNVNTDKIEKLENVNTGCAFINVDKNGENSIVVVSGANKKITTETINNNINLIEQADIIVMQLEIPIEVVEYVAKIAKEKGKIVILDPAPAIPNLSRELLSNVDIIKPNETEIQIVSGMQIESIEDMVKAARSLIDNGVKTVIVTLGGEGSLLVTSEKEERFPSLGLKPIDTTAAGDSFTAALAKSLVEGKELEEAIRYAHIVSSIVITRKGAQTSIPTQDEIDEFLKEWRKN